MNTLYQQQQRKHLSLNEQQQQRLNTMINTNTNNNNNNVLLLHNRFLPLFKNPSTPPSSSTDIYYALDTITNQHCILKMLKQSHNTFLNDHSSKLINEDSILKRLSHVNIIKLITEISLPFRIKGKKDIIYIPLEYAGNGDLLSIVNMSNEITHSGLSENASLFLFEQLMNGVQFIHSKGICHRDIKLDNIFITEEFEVKLGDFENAECFVKGGSTELVKMKDKIGTEMYMAPEMHFLHNENMFYYGNQVDIFACGIVLIAMLTGKQVFETTNDCDFYFRKFCYTPNEFFRLFEGHCSEDVVELIKLMIEIDGSKRANAEQICNWEGFKKVNINEAKKELKQIICKG